MARYTNLTNGQLFTLAVLVGCLSSAINVAVRKYDELQLLPAVTVNPAGQCIKVTNFENGHAFGCPDVDVLLRRYRKVTSTAS